MQLWGARKTRSWVRGGLLHELLQFTILPQ